MDINTDELEVHNNPEAGRFEIKLGDKFAIAEYMIAGKNMVFTHTEVPPEYEGKGVANRLAKVALDYARDEGYRIQPVCPFITLYIRKHEEYQAITWGYE